MASRFRVLPTLLKVLYFGALVSFFITLSGGKGYSADWVHTLLGVAKSVDSRFVLESPWM